MKRISIIAALGILMFTQCQQGPSRQELMLQNDTLREMGWKKDSAIYSLMNTFSSIEDNLQAIKDKENIIALTAEE